MPSAARGGHREQRHRRSVQGHRHRLPPRGAARPVDVAHVHEVGRPRPHVRGTTTPTRRRGSSATSAWRRSAPPRRPGGTSTRRRTRPAGRTPTRTRGTPSSASSGWTSTACRPRCSIPTSPCSTRPCSRSRRRRAWRSSHPGLQRLPDRVVQRRPDRLIADHHAAVLGPRRHARRDRAVRGDGPPRHRVHPGPVGASASRSSPTRTGTRCGPRPRSCASRSTSTSPRATCRCSTNIGHPVSRGADAIYASMGVSFFLSNARTIANLICGGICHRFPDLDFVSVESGVGWIPFALDALDWQWKNCGVALEHPEYDLLPSEYFAPPDLRLLLVRGGGARSTPLDRLGPDNLLYETDFPHPTSMSPGPGARPRWRRTSTSSRTSPASTRTCWQGPARQRGPALQARLTRRAAPTDRPPARRGPGVRRAGRSDA